MALQFESSNGQDKQEKQEFNMLEKKGGNNKQIKEFSRNR